MPSGAKKRKAAKKKQASHSIFPSHPSSTTHSQSGDDDMKHRDGRDSDGGNGEVLEKREDSSSVRSFVSKSKSDQGENTTNDEEGIIQIDWKVKPEEDYESSDIGIGSKKKSHDGSSSGSSISSRSSSSSSSEDESHVVEKKIVVVEDAPAIVDLVKPLDSFPVKVAEVVDDVVKPINLSSEGLTQVNESSLVGEVDNLMETISVDKVSLEQVAHVIESISVENGSSSHVPESFLEVNDIKNSPSLDKNIGNSGSSSDAKVSVATEIEANPSNGSGHVEESETSQYSDSQPLVASAPRIVQTTSWKSCCGIFELFTGSNK